MCHGSKTKAERYTLTTELTSYKPADAWNLVRGRQREFSHVCGSGSGHVTAEAETAATRPRARGRRRSPPCCHQRLSRPCDSTTAQYCGYVILAAPLAPCLVLTPAFQFSSSSVIFPNKIYVKSFHELRFPCSCTDTAVGRSGSLLICPPPRQVCERRTRLAAAKAGRSSPASILSQRHFHFRDLAVLTGPLSPGTPGSLPFSAHAAQEALLTSRWGAAPSLLSQPQESDPHGDSRFYFCFHHKDLAGGLSVNLHHHIWPLKGVQKALWNKQ